MPTSNTAATRKLEYEKADRSLAGLPPRRAGKSGHDAGHEHEHEPHRNGPADELTERMRLKHDQQARACLRTGTCQTGTCRNGTRAGWDRLGRDLLEGRGSAMSREAVREGRVGPSRAGRRPQ